MSDKAAASAPLPGTAAEDTAAEPSDQVIAEGVDEEPIESNRRQFEGWALLSIAGLAMLYAAFHMAALNGLSLERITGINIPFLPQFPLETWNFRMVHIAGALALGFLLFAAYPFTGTDTFKPAGRVWTFLSATLLIPVAIAAWTAFGFIAFLQSDQPIEMLGRAAWVSMSGPVPEAFAVYGDIYARELWGYGIPLLIATFGGIVLGWFERTGRNQFAAADIILALCAIVVALYLIPIYGTNARNQVGTPNVAIGVAFAATAGTALILELTRRVAGLALVVITFIFLAYTFTAHLLPGILSIDNAYTWHRFFGHVYSDAGILGPTTAVSSTYIILFIILLPSCRLPRWAIISSTLPLPPRGVRAVDRPRWQFLHRA
jgi:TRAP-type uncharacterized transport system fused permease subunit